jgi:protein-disulfide isomerase
MAAHMVILLSLWVLASPGASPGASEPTKTTVPAGPALTSFPAVDTSHLDAAGKSFFEKVANDEVCPCDCPKSFGQCLQEGTKCKPAVLLANWIIQNLENGATAQDMQESITRELTSGFASAPKKIDLGFASKGSNSPKYTVVEYADFECQHCRAASPILDELVKQRSDVRLVYKHYPLPFHAMARPAAVAAEAAGRQGKFWEMHDAIFATQDLLSDDLLLGHARALGLDAAKFAKDLKDPELAKKVDASAAEGKANGVEFTPYIFVNGRPYFLARSLEGFAVRFQMEDARATSSCQ